MDAFKRGVCFIPVGWEITLGGVGRPQELINQELRQCDYFILILWDRWGTPTGTGTYSSGTEEEYTVALNCLNDIAFPMRDIVVFFRAVDVRMLSDPGVQLQKVLDFKKKLEEEKRLLFYTYDEISLVEKRLRYHLAKWVRDHEEFLKQMP